jgi:hypothetical protein
MLRAALRQLFHDPAQAARLRGWSAAVLLVMLAGWCAGGGAVPAETIEVIAWTIFLAAIIAGGVFTGWRVAQFPKSRAAEFQLVAPVSDLHLIASQVAAGLLRTALVVLAAAPVVAALWGGGWIAPTEAAALLAIPVAAGWLAGLALAVIAYEPAWVRRLCERLVLAAVLAYLVLFGLAGAWFLPWALRTWYAWTGSSAWGLTNTGAVLRYFNPFRLLGAVGHGGTDGLPLRVAGVFGLLLLLCMLCVWRLAVRLRRHYLEENFGVPRRRRRFVQSIGDNPLAWWTARRVSRFRGHVNLYLAWGVVTLYSAWLLLGDRWPAWMATGVLRRIADFGGEALLATAALQLAVIGVAFLDGLWDSNRRERINRLELLLAAPLPPRHWLTASAVAGWTRGRGYVLAALVLWITAAAAGRFTWPTCLALCVVSFVWMLWVFAVAFALFTRLADDRRAAAWGLLLSLGPPLLTAIFLAAGWMRLAALSPLGALYFLAMPATERLAGAGLTSIELFALIAASSALHLAIALILLRAAHGAFHTRMREAFARALVR